MEILPVLDLLNGIVVRGIAGRRSEYQPLSSILTLSHQPLDVARALRSSFGFRSLYVADLDAILRGRANWDTYRRLMDDGFELQVDAGIRDVASAIRICDAGAKPIVGLESCSSPRVLAEIASRIPDGLTFSLDLLNGLPKFAGEACCQNSARHVGNALHNEQGQSTDDTHEWSWDPYQIVRQVARSGVGRIIVLDLADVGTSNGGRTDKLCQFVIERFPKLQLICGGGVRGMDDLRRLEALGASSALVASALHDGRLTPSRIQTLHED